MLRRSSKALICALIAGQLLLSAPVVGALASSQGGAMAEMPCADMMPPAPDGEPCPCCPDAAQGPAACLASCTAMIGALPAFDLPLQPDVFVKAFVLPPPPLPVAAQAPLNPPPIV